jgi:hypothetical protein
MKYCTNKTSNFCSNKDSSYIGKYHVGYMFRTKYGYDLSFVVCMILPSLFTNSYILSIIWLLFIILINIIFRNIRDGERGAIWCLLSIFYAIPVVYYREYILDIIDKIKIY